MKTVNDRQKNLIKQMVEGVFGKEAANDPDIISAYEDAFVESNRWLIEKYFEYSQRAMEAEQFIFNMRHPSSVIGMMNILNIGLRSRCGNFLRNLLRNNEPTAKAIASLPDTLTELESVKAELEKVKEELRLSEKLKTDYFNGLYKVTDQLTQVQKERDALKEFVGIFIYQVAAGLITVGVESTIVAKAEKLLTSKSE